MSFYVKHEVMTTGRRQFLKFSALSGIAAVVHPPLNSGFHFASKEGLNYLKAKPTFPQMEWQDSEFGVIFHFDISIGTRNFRGDNATRETFDPKQYNPAKLDTDQWVRAAKKAGATYVIFTATHFGGFMQWQSDLYPYGLKQAAWENGKGDIVADFVKSCDKYHIKPGLYLSTHRNAYWHVDNHYVAWGKGKGTDKQKEYNDICEKMTEELCAHYGRLLQIWYDAGVMTPAEGGPDVLPIFEKYQPNGIFYNSLQRSDMRWVGNEDGFADYPCWATMPSGAASHNAPSWRNILGKGDSSGGIWSPAMVDVPLRGANGVHSWFWHPGQETGVYGLQRLLNIYDQSVGRNSNMLLGVVIDPDGLVPETDAQRLAELGSALREKFGSPLGSTKGVGKDFVIDLKTPLPLKQYVLQEDIQFGERVQSYLIKGRLSNGNWVAIHTGTCVGHKRIGQIKSTENFRQIALQIIESKDTPFIREFVLY
jgi:alpha-L-fucosidase